MSAFQALARGSGAVSRRLPGNRARFSRLIWVVPPLLAAAVVVAVHSQPSGSPTTAAPYQPPAAEPADPLADVRPVTDIVPLGGVDTSDTDRRIGFWRARTEQTPSSETAWTYLGDLLDLKGRQTGDVSSFVAAEQAYARALEIAPRSPDAHIGAARIKATLHDFDGALAEATAVLEIDPSSAAALAVLFDASLEMGDLDNAALTLDLLKDRVESPAVLVREARLAFLRGDSAAAVELAAQATADAEGRGDPNSTLAFFHYTAAEYGLLAGDLESAEDGFDRALAAMPGYPLAIYGHGRVAFARGDLAAAIAHVETAVAAVPRPDMLAYLGDLYAASGDGSAAESQYQTVEFIAGLAAADGSLVYNREYALFLADHARDRDRAIELARAELEQRRDVYGYDTLAWTLHAAGRDAEALEPMRSALASGIGDPKLLIHAGLIELGAGLAADGRAHLERALALSPSFSPLLVEAAVEALAR